MSEQMVSGKLTGRERYNLAQLAARLRKLAEALEHGEAGLDGAADAIRDGMSSSGSVVHIHHFEAEAVRQLYALITEE